ncbi:MAG: hypothetical protein Q8R36_03765 [bacterium]|nr:hypothetical protein [bacterium]
MESVRKKTYQLFFLFLGSTILGLVIFLLVIYSPLSITAFIKSYTQRFLNISPREQNLDLISTRSGIVRSVDYKKNKMIIDFIDPYEEYTIKTVQVSFNNNTVVQKRAVFLENGIIYAIGRNNKSSMANIKIGKPAQVTSLILEDELQAISILYGDILF